jgi:2-polyprenyl-3-methyl-5-hydroxy-6-metoxy-1,4-benzoquinol methylase
VNVPPEVMLQDSACPLGCTRQDENVLTGRDLLHDLPGEFTVVRCCTCGLMRTNPRPTPETIGFYYPDDYGPYLGTQVRQQQAPKSGIKRLLGPIVRKIFNFNTDVIPAMHQGRMLEVGCASGAYLHRMANKGWTVEGVEFSPKAAHAARSLGYPVHVGSLETAPEPGAPFDLIVGWMVLEHLHDPVGCLQKLKKWAKPGAWLVLAIPNAAALEFRLFKEKWYALQLPTHLYHFTPKTLAQVLQAGGWTLQKVHHQRVLSNLIASAGYVFQDKGYAELGQKLVDFPEGGGRWPYALYPLAWLLGMFGQTGRMTVWARVNA